MKQKKPTYAELQRAVLLACIDFIENVPDDDPKRTEKFFALREQWRTALAAEQHVENLRS